MKKEYKTLLAGLILALILLLPTLSRSQSICTQTTCLPFYNTDMYQIYGAIRNNTGGTVTAVTSTVTIPMTLTSYTVGVGTSNVTSGCKGLQFLTSPTFSGTINNVGRLSNTVYTFGYPPPYVLPLINYSVTVGSITIDEQR